MTKEKILEGNKLIEKFLAGESWIESEFQARGVDNKNYHNDWNWLMRAVEKIEAIDENLMDGSGLNIHFTIGKRATRVVYDWATYSIISPLNALSEDFEKFNNSFKDYRHSIFDESKLLSTFQAVVDFITWYNAQVK